MSQCPMLYAQMLVNACILFTLMLLHNMIYILLLSAVSTRTARSTLDDIQKIQVNRTFGDKTRT